MSYAVTTTPAGNVDTFDPQPCDSVYWTIDGRTYGGVVTCLFGSSGIAVTDFDTGEDSTEIDASWIVAVVR